MKYIRVEFVDAKINKIDNYYTVKNIILTDIFNFLFLYFHAHSVYYTENLDINM